MASKGERVVDVGSEAGFDSFVASRLVGPNGNVVGLDMTQEMLTKARSTATTIEGGWADVVISNDVNNLCADKRAVFSEIHRVLRPGGWLQFAGPQSAAALCSIAAVAGRLAFRNVRMCRTASGIFSGTSFHGYMLTCALGASIADSIATA